MLAVPISNVFGNEGSVAAEETALRPGWLGAANSIEGGLADRQSEADPLVPWVWDWVDA